MSCGNAVVLRSPSAKLNPETIAGTVTDPARAKAGRRVGSMPAAWRIRFLHVVPLLLLFSGILYGQATGTITGTARDASGAVVPDARVTAVNTQTNLTRTVNTDSAGLYVIPLLAVGSYEVRIEKQGFSPFLQKGVLLQANTQVQVDAVLQVAQAAEVVTVSSTPSLVQTNTSNLVQITTSKSITELPLNGRNALQLVNLSAGVLTKNVPNTENQTVNLGRGLYFNAVSMVGARGGSANYLLDNADNNEATSMAPRPFPNVDAVEEFSLQTNSFDAQYGRSVGGVINVVTKSGTNEIHGSVFEFMRNFKLNAADYFSGRDALKRNQFGGSLGGPLVRDRTFLFGSYQGMIMRTATPAAVSTAPSAAMRQGDFSEWLIDGKGMIRDPNAPNTYFPNNQIPVSRFDPVSANLLKLIPTSSSSNYQIRYGTPSRQTNDHQGVMRFDHSLTDRQRITGRYLVFRYDAVPSNLPNNVLWTSAGQWGYSQSLLGSHTFTISPRWLHTTTLSYSFSAPKSFHGSEPDVSLGTLGARVKTIPGFNLLMLNISGWSGVGYGTGSDVYSRTLHYAQSASYATGRHNLRFGGEIRRYRTGFSGYYRAGGDVSFNGQLFSDPGRQNAGNSYAEFLLGQVASYWQVGISLVDVRQANYGLFIQDDVRLTDKLTVNLGLRWDPKAAMRDADGRGMAWSPGQKSKMFPNAPTGIVFTGDTGFEGSVVRPALKNISPRIGLAYQLAPRTVIRAAYGIYYDEFCNILYNTLAQGLPYTPQINIVGPVQLSDPFSGGPMLDALAYKPDPAIAFPDYLTYFPLSRDIRPADVQSWNFVLERQFSSDLLVRATYVGSKGSHLLNMVERNAPVYGPGATSSNRNARRPYPLVGSVNDPISGANSSYNALLLTVQKRYSKGLSIIANYTTGKSIDVSSASWGNSPGPDPYNHKTNRGPSDFDVSQRLVVSGVWEMPQFSNLPRAARAVLGGWQSNVIFSAQTGVPLTIRSGVDTNVDGIGGDFADYNGGEWRMPSGRSKEEQIKKWFNTSVFSIPQTGFQGTGRRGQLRAPGDYNVDYSLFKNIQLRERARLQLRGEFFNFLNHANLGSPNTSVNSTAFGEISSTNGGPRIVQVAAKIIF